MSQRRLPPNEVQILQEALEADVKGTNLRLREGEYQYSLVKAIAAFQLELTFPDVKDITRRLYGEEKANDLQFIRKIQTILKKMEKSGIVEILPKKKPWELQRYALSSFKFQDSDKNLVNLVTEQEVRQTQGLLYSAMAQQQRAETSYVKVSLLGFAAAGSYAATVWALVQPRVEPLVFVPALSLSAVCSILLGRVLSRE